MRRFEQPGAPGNFFEVEVSGDKLTVRFGPRDRMGKQLVRPFASDAAAAAEADRLVADHVEKGYLETVRGVPIEVSLANEARDQREAVIRERARRQDETRAAATTGHEPALEAQCRASPDDPAPWAVYADWLIEHGDPRGEVAALQLRGNATRAAEVLAFYRLAWDDVTFEFRHGFAVAATVKAANMYEPPFDLLATTKRLLASPMADFLESLRFGLAEWKISDANWRPTFELVASSPVAERLRVLRFDAYEYDDRMMSHHENADFSGLWDRFPALEELRLRGDRMTLGTLALPKLRTLVREAAGMGPGDMEPIASATWPALVHLELWGCGGPDGFEPIFDARRVPKLRHLGCVNTSMVDDIIPALARSKLLPQLESLDFRMGTMSARSTARLVEHAAAFRHLAAIDLRENQLSDDEVDQIRRVLDNVITLDQREIGDYEDWGDAGPPDDVEQHRYAAEYE